MPPTDGNYGFLSFTKQFHTGLFLPFLPCCFDPPISDGRTGLPVWTETLRVDYVLSWLGCDVLAILRTIAGRQLKKFLFFLVELRKFSTYR